MKMSEKVNGGKLTSHLHKVPRIICKTCTITQKLLPLLNVSQYPTISSLEAPALQIPSQDKGLNLQTPMQYTYVSNLFIYLNPLGSWNESKYFKSLK